MSQKRGKIGTASCFHCILTNKREGLAQLLEEEQINPLAKQVCDKKCILKHSGFHFSKVGLKTHE